jgi:hypothetical protein
MKFADQYMFDIPERLARPDNPDYKAYRRAVLSLKLGAVGLAGGTALELTHNFAAGLVVSGAGLIAYLGGVVRADHISDKRLVDWGGC